MRAPYADSQIRKRTIGMTGAFLITMMASNVAVASDWATRSTGAGVKLATNFNVQSEVTDYLVDRDGNPWADRDHVSWYTANKTSGNGSMRMDIRATDYDSSGQWWRWIDDAWKDNNFNRGFKTGEEFFVQFRIFHPASYVNQQFLDAQGDPSGAKLAIVSNAYQANRLYELVLQDTNEQKTYQGYNRDANGSYLPWDAQINDDRCGGFPDTLLQPAIDRGEPSSGTPCERMRGRYGGLWSYQWVNGSPDGIPDPLSGAVKIEADQWQTVLLHINVGTFNSSPAGEKKDTRIRYYVANAGEDYQLLYDDYIAIGSEGGGTRDNADAYNAVWLLTYGTNRAPGAGNPARVDTYVLYDELIVSTNWIPAPDSAGGSGDKLAPSPPQNLRAN